MAVDKNGNEVSLGSRVRLCGQVTSIDGNVLQVKTDNDYGTAFVRGEDVEVVPDAACGPQKSEK